MGPRPDTRPDIFRPLSKSFKPLEKSLPDTIIQQSVCGNTHTYTYTYTEKFKNIDKAKLDNIAEAELAYKRVGAFSIFMYITNMIFSAIIVAKHTTGLYTVVSFTTYSLFIFTKFIRVGTNIYSEDNIYLSAYLNNQVQYNDVDPEHYESVVDKV